MAAYFVISRASSHSRSTNSSVYRWVPSPCGAPDVPHVVLECRHPLAEGNDVGVFKAPPVSASDFSNRDHHQQHTPPVVARRLNKNDLQNSNKLSKLTFKICPVASLEVKWETTLVKDVLYVELPSGILPEGSKESLITLLEYAEDELRCSHVVLCIAKNRSDRGSLLRVFNFFGFQILPPGHILIRSPSPDVLHMAYAIQHDDDDDDDDDEDSGGGGEEEEESSSEEDSGGGGGEEEEGGNPTTTIPPTPTWKEFAPFDFSPSSSSSSKNED